MKIDYLEFKTKSLKSKNPKTQASASGEKWRIMQLDIKGDTGGLTTACACFTRRFG